MKRPADNSNERKKRKYLKTSDCENSPLDTHEEGELGIIESVTVQNFMCHENLTLNFEPHMNFIIGQNGSGKSAILTAIILALGGKSSSTDRFTNIKGFVKAGKNKAKVEVVLRNTGNLAYKPDVYGDKIIVIREFSKEGVSSYKIKSESGTICSNQKSELINIIDTMDIMVECPVCVLTQATSKRFLISKDAKAERLFEFFYKGTGLEMLENKYKSMTIMKEEAEAELEKKKQTLPDLKKELRKWKKYLDSSRKISDYKNELIWVGVIQMEKLVEEKVEAYKKSEQEFEGHKRDMDGCTKSLAEKSSELDELYKQKSTSETEMGECRRKLEELKSEHENHASSCRRNKGTLLKLENDKKKLADDILGLEKCINEQKRKDQRNLEEEEKSRQEAEKKLADKNQNLENKLRTLKERIHTTRSEKSNFVKVIENLRTEVNQHLYEVDNIEQNLTATKNAIKSKVNAFGEHTEKVLYDIRNMQSRFRKQPVGPIGMHLEVTDPRWAAGVEFATGSSLLNSFCVDNHQDSLLLKEILKKYYARPPSIIVSPFESKIFDVQHGRVQSSFPSVLDMLVIKNYLVANCLIDQAQIEKKIVVENEKEGVNLMSNPPKNCQSAYFMNCDQICFNPSRIYSFGKRIPRSRFSAIRPEVVTKLENERKEKLDKIKELNKRIETMSNAENSIPKKIENLEREVVKISKEYNLNLMEMKDIQRKDETKNMDCLQEDLETLRRSFEEKKEKIIQCSQLISQLEAKRIELQTQINVQSASLKSSNEDYQRLLMKIRDVSKLKESFASGKKKYENEQRMKENRCNTLRKDLEYARERLETARSSAELAGPRMDTDKSYEELTRLIEETEKVVEKQSNCDRESLSKKYQEKLENLSRAEIELIKIERYLSRIGQMIKNRNVNFQKIRKNTELLINLSFTTILRGNGYTGHLLFTRDGTLSMNVSPRAGDSTRKNHSSLSGGERSFVTIAFLLALWERTKMPFRILDEYDVFMDSSNRQLSVDLLCKKAVQMAKTQFIFLSPLELTRMPDSEYIHVLKMAPPKRKAVDDENSPRKKRA